MMEGAFPSEVLPALEFRNPSGRATAVPATLHASTEVRRDP